MRGENCRVVEIVEGGDEGKGGRWEKGAEEGGVIVAGSSLKARVGVGVGLKVGGGEAGRGSGVKVKAGGGEGVDGSEVAGGDGGVEGRGAGTGVFLGVRTWRWRMMCWGRGCLVVPGARKQRVRW